MATIPDGNTPRLIPESESPPRLEELCRVDDFINVYKLQSVMNTLVRRMDAQQAHIEKLEHQLQHKAVSDEQFAAYSKSVDERLTNIESTITRWGTAWSKIETAAAHMDSYNDKMNELISNLSQKVDLADFAQLKFDVSEAFDLHRHELDEEKASRESVVSLEDSQRRLLEECVALQQLIACKVDRVEIPLLNVAGDKLKRLVTFAEQCGPRLSSLEETAAVTSRLVAGKVDTAAVEERLAYLHEQLRERPEFQWLHAKVLDPLDCVQKDLGGALQAQEDVARALEQVELLTQRVEGARRESAEATGNTTALRRRVEELNAAVTARTSVSDVEALLGDRDRAVEEVLSRQTQRAAADARVQAAAVADLRGELARMRGTQGTLEQRVGVVVKFVDWFTDVKLRGESGA